MSASMLKYLIAADSLCDGENGVSLTALALKAGVTKVSAYRAVDRLETDGYLSRESKKKIVLTKKGVDSLRTYMREVYVLRDALMQICKLPRNVAYHEGWISSTVTPGTASAAFRIVSMASGVVTSVVA